MEIIETPIEGLLVFKPRTFKDDRGAFFESFNQLKFDELTKGEFNLFKIINQFQKKEF